MRKELWHKGTLVILAAMLVAAALVLAGGALLSSNAPVAVSDPVQYVNPFLGTAPSAAGNYAGASINSGNVFPGAVYPHGMLQWSPDTTGAPGGYRYLQHTIYGFSLTHFSGRGCSAYQDVPFMPTLGPLTVSPANSRAYGSSYSHSRESASPGYYSVHLDSTNIQVALTVTPRTGFGQFTYPSSTGATMLINTGGSATGDASNGTGVRILGSNQVVGSATSGNFCGGGNTYTVYFAAIFDHPFTGFGTWNGALLQPGERSSGGSHSGAYLTFDTTHAATVQVRVAISFVSVANAWLNLASENPGWNFDAVRSRVSAAWEQQLSRITIAGGTHDEQVSFYTALYHALIHPNIFSDVNGQYIGFDKRIHVAQGYTQYENFPGWDMYRSLIALLAILEPRETGDMLQSLVADARQGGGGLPRWEVANDNSGGMVGDSIDVVIATAYAFGVRNFDTQAALAAMVEGATLPGTHSGKHVVREALGEYLAHGYVSTGTPGSASITLEYAVDDFAIAQFARALGQSATYHTFLRRALNWQTLFNAASGYIEPRNPDGTFLASFSPTRESGFVEGDSAQYTWMVQDDLPDLFHAMGGNTTVVKRLDYHFQQLDNGPISPYAFMGNEPEFEIPWEYDAAGAPSHTQQVVRRIQTQLFLDSPAGLPGNDDGGAMSSWYIFSALGLYPEIPGVSGFFVGSPLFPQITIHLENGDAFQITAAGTSAVLDNTPYVQGLTLNGVAYNNSWLPFATIQTNTDVQFRLSGQRDPTWGNAIHGLPALQ